MRYDPVVERNDSKHGRLSSVSSAGEDDDAVPDGFDEVAYAEAYPDVAAAVEAGMWTSVLQHYKAHGASENRLADRRYIQAAAGGNTAHFPRASVDRGYITRSGQCLISGWVSDSPGVPLRQITVRQGQYISAVSADIARYRRDASSLETMTTPRCLGFWSLLVLGKPFDPEGEFDVVLFAGPNRRSFPVRFQSVMEEELRDIALRHPGWREVFC